MARDPGVVKAMFAHVLGPDGPSAPLLQEGRFPEGWVAEYHQLLEVAHNEWHAEMLWPRELAPSLDRVESREHPRPCLGKDSEGN